MYNPATRVLTVLELLQTHPQLSGQALAERLEVDTRTIRRYIIMLQDMGIPIESERGRYGGYRLRPGYKLPPLMFNEDEGVALVLGLLLNRRLGQGVMGIGLESALAKIERVMPLELKERVQALQATLTIEMPAVNAVPPSSKVVMTISLALHQSQRVVLTYKSWQGAETIRRFDPYGLVYRVGYWYTVGYCHLRQGLRTFRIDRVVSVTISDELFTPPTDFDALPQVERSIALTPNPWRVEVILQTTLVEAQKFVPPALATLDEFGPEQVRMICYAPDLAWMAYILAGLDCPLEVRHPPELCEALHQLAEKVTAQATSFSQNKV